MKHWVWVLSSVLLLATVVQASLTIHLQSPFRNDATASGYTPHIVGGVTDYNPGFGLMSRTMMQSEGEDWYVYSWSDKGITDFQDWQDFEFKVCPNTEDNNYNNNNCVSWTQGGKNRITAFFGEETEVWLYTDPSDMSYTKSFVPPGSKLVWFKSPWGNKALPQMIFGEDSVMMRFAQGDPSKCGWFYGAISPEMLRKNPLQTAHFIRLNAPYLSMPAQGVVELADYFALADTVYIDGTADAAIDISMGTLGECFDSTRTLHVYHPWRTNTTYRDSALYISVQSNIAVSPKAMDSTGEYKYWWHYDFLMDSIRSSDWNSAGALVNFHSSSNQGKSYFQEISWNDPTIVDKRPSISSFFPKGVYEAWVYTTSSGNYEVIYSPLEEKVVRLMSPWDNRSEERRVGKEC